PSQEWITVPVPALVSAEQFDLVTRRLAANQRAARRSTTHRSLEVSRSASSSGGPPNGPAAPAPPADPLTEAGLPPGQAAWSPRGAPKPNVRCWRMGRSLHRPPGDQPSGCFDPLVGCSHTATARTEHTESYICSPTLTRQRTVPTPRTSGRTT